MRWITKLGSAGAKGLGLAVLLLGGAVGAKGQVAYINEYRPSSVNLSRAVSITAGPDGALWFVDQSTTNTVWRVTTAGGFVSYELGYRGVPNAITAGPDGAMWVVESGADTWVIVRVTTDGRVTGYEMPDYPHIATLLSICAGPDGALWFTGSQLTYPSGSSVDLIGRITTDGRITQYAASGGQIIAGPDGALWFTTGNGIGRITTQGVVTSFATPTPSSVYGITTGPDGALWFTEPAINKIGRMTIAGAVTEYPIPTPGSNPGEITQGPDGALWFTEQYQIGRITTAGDITEYGDQFRNWNTIPGERLSPISITAGPDGDIWFTDMRGVIGQVGFYQGRPITHVLPLPKFEMVANFLVQWTGIGAESYTLYVLDDNASPVPWLTTTATQTIFAGTLHHQYTFYTIGTDSSGNQENVKGWPPEAATFVSAAPGDLTGDGAVNCADLAVVMASFGKRIGQPGYNPVADVNQDGVVNVRDLSWVSQYLVPGTKCQ